MKNRYLKGAHLSERKVRELIKLFSEDLTATQIANITGISRITVNAYFKLIRTHIAKFCEERNPFHFINGTVTYHASENGAVSGMEPHQRNRFTEFSKTTIPFTPIKSQTSMQSGCTIG